MSREVIAVDVDEVLFPFVPEFIEYDNQRFGSGIRIEDFKTYQFENVLNIAIEEAVERVYDFNASNHEHISPLERAREAISELNEEFELTVVTARHPKFESNTLEWLDTHLQGFFSDVVHIGYAPVMEKPLKKVDVCKDLGAIALIDDSVGHVSECAEQGIQGVLFGCYPWNQAESLPPGVVRCLHWPDVVEYFLGKT
jgi:5'(3')-deoxyribonucleotidase